MRIRKRLPPLPLSDPHSDKAPVVQLHNNRHPHHNFPQLADSATFFHPQPSDEPNRPIGTVSKGSNCSDNQEKKDCSILLRKEPEKGLEEEKSNDSRKKSMLGAEIVGTGIVSESSSSHQAVGRWCEGEKAFPLKKRRGNLERKAKEETIVEKDNKKMKEKFGLKDEEGGGGEGERKENGEAAVSGKKKRGRGGGVMEGSRCSRVNGRGWRCCQQTLVGYSLCEHHLGKGRLRSMSIVRSRALGTCAPNNNDSNITHPPLIPECEQKNEVGEEDQEEDEKPLMMSAGAAKKRMKVGMVKARSMSSLLGLGQSQTNNEVKVCATKL